VELDAGLKAQLRRGLGLRKTFDDADLTGILTPADELKYWQDCGRAAEDLKQREHAKVFSTVLTPLAPEFDDLHKRTFAQLIDFQDNLLVICDRLWQCGRDKNNAETANAVCYEQKRMEHFLRICGSFMARIVQEKLTKLDVWRLKERQKQRQGGMNAGDSGGQV
jgi:hypothetical protein